MTNPIPDYLPANLVLIIDQAINSLLKNKQLPKNLSLVYKWFEEDGIDHLISPEATLPFVLNLQSILQNFYDEEVANENEVGVAEVTDQMRISYARTEIKAACDFQRAGYDILSVYCAPIKGSTDMLVFLGCTAEEQGQNGMGLDWWGLYKSQDDFLNEIRNTQGFVICTECDSINEKQILECWN